MKRSTDLKVEVWRKDEEFHLIGEAIVPKVEQIHHLDIIGQGKKEGVLVISYKEEHSNENNYKLGENAIKLVKPKNLIKRLNESLTAEAPLSINFGSVQEYFDSQLDNQELSLQAKQLATSITTQSFNKVMGKVSIGDIAYHFDEPEQKDEIEQQRIKALQKQLIKKDLQKYEKSRREVHLQILDLDDMDVRFEQIEQKQQILALRKELVQKLLYIEDKIEHLKRHMKLDAGKNGSVASLHSMAEMSQISLYKEPTMKAEVDPQKEEQRQEFVRKQMKEWNELQEKRKKQIEEQERKLEKTENKIKEQQELVLQAKTKEKREEIEQRLKKLKAKQAQREQNLLDQNKRYQEKIKSKHLAEKYAQQDAVYMLQLQEIRKAKLKELKKEDFDIKEINQFDKKMKELRKEKAAKRQKEWEDREKQWNNFQAKYYSESYKRAKVFYKEVDVREEEQKQKTQDRINLLKSYENEVRSRYQPHVSQEKKQELEENIRKLKYEPNFKKYRELSERVKEKHIYFGVEQKEQALNKKVKLKPLENIPTPISPRKIGDFYLREHATNNKKHIPPLPKAPEPPKSSQSEQKLVVRDYLKEQRIKKQQHEQQYAQQTNQSLGLENDDHKMIAQIRKQLEKLEHI